MIIVTGSSGFIAGALVRRLLSKKVNNIIICDFENKSFNDKSLTFYQSR